MTRMIGLLSWYAEPVSWLAELVASMGRAGIDHVVALDGAYILYPRGQAHSEGDQADTIRRVATGYGMGATIHVPSTPWCGNEVEKRDALFRLGHAVAEPGDWLWVCDGDEVIEATPRWLRSELELTREDVGTVVLRVQQDPQSPSEFFPIPKLFRSKAEGPIRVVERHDRYVGPGGEQLWVPSADDADDVVSWSHFEEVVVLHRIHQRPAHRVLERAAYYLRRQEAEAEV
jgi:hypothetical protein